MENIPLPLLCIQAMGLLDLYPFVVGQGRSGADVGPGGKVAECFFCYLKGGSKSLLQASKAKHLSAYQET